MVQSKYLTLLENEVVEDGDANYGEADVTEENGRCDCDEFVQKKKHGVWCKILTTLHLKKKHSHTTNDATKETKTSKRRKLNLTKLRPKIKNKHKKNQPYEEINAEDEDLANPANNYAPIPDQNGEKFVYRGRRVDFAIVPERYELLEEAEFDEVSITDDSGIHEKSISSDNDGDEVCLCRDDVTIHDDSTALHSIGKSLKKQWNGKRAKSARKSIRRTSSYSWKSLQIGLRPQHLMPDVTQITTALNSNLSARNR